jgi:hypothetical protein
MARSAPREQSNSIALCRNYMTESISRSRQGCKLHAAADEEPVGSDEKGVRPLAHNGYEGGIDLVAGAGVEHLTLQPDGACSFRYIP